jgi:hypothetical protein
MSETLCDVLRWTRTCGGGGFGGRRSMPTGVLAGLVTRQPHLPLMSKFGIEYGRRVDVRILDLIDTEVFNSRQVRPL